MTPFLLAALAHILDREAARSIITLPASQYREVTP